jgi:uncharacterized membrane protein YeaQ/YmgE (transglycosylase-associated protein family)
MKDRKGLLSDSRWLIRCLEWARINYFYKGKNMFSLLGTLLVGLVVGLLARALKPGDDKLGWIMTCLLGVAGSFLATYVGMAMGWYQQGDAAGWIASIVGAVILLFIYGLVKSKT